MLTTRRSTSGEGNSGGKGCIQNAARVLAPAFVIAIIFLICGRTVRASENILDLMDGVVDPDMSVITKEVMLTSAVTAATYVISIVSVIFCAIIGAKTIASKEDQTEIFGALMITFSGIGFFVGIFEIVALCMAAYRTHKKDNTPMFAVSLILLMLRITAIFAALALIIGILAKTAG